MSDDLSDKELAHFLQALAHSLRDRRSGNPALARGLLRLAGELAHRQGDGQGPTVSGAAQSQLPRGQTLQALRGLNSDQVRAFINDEGKTKEEIVEMASLRFSIPQSKLRRINISAVREAVEAALAHEESLTAISEEAARHGSRRQS